MPVAKGKGKRTIPRRKAAFEDSPFGGNDSSSIVCRPRKPPYLKDLREEAKKKKIVGYSTMTKEELCERLGLIEKAGPKKVRKTPVKRNVVPKEEVSPVTKMLDAYVKKNGLIARSVKEKTRPPPGMADYYYIYQPLQNYERLYIVPEGFEVSVPSSTGVKKVPLKYQDPNSAGAYIKNTKNHVLRYDIKTTSYTPIYGKGIDAWFKPSPSYSVYSKRKGFDKYLKDIDADPLEFKKLHLKDKGMAQAELRRAGKKYVWPS